MLEERLDQIFGSEMNITGPPTLLVLDSAYWNSLRFIERRTFSKAAAVRIIRRYRVGWPIQNLHITPGG